MSEANAAASRRYRARYPERNRASQRRWRTVNKDQRNKLRLDAQKQLRNRVAQIKLAAGCADCGYASHSAALDFDHRDPSTKVGNVAAMVCSRSWDSIEAEIAKCDVVCANCHRVRTATRSEHD